MFTLKRCPVCFVGESFCICSVRPRVRLPFQLVILSNPEEFIKPTNTARLVTGCSPDAEIFEWKRKEPPLELINSMNQPHVYPYVLNPIQSAVTFVEADFFNQKKGSKIILILLDGTWKQSRKMYSHSNYLKTIPALRLDTDSESRYLLRNQKDPSRLSTIETVIEALACFKENQSARQLDSYFKVFQWAYLHSKMNKKSEFNARELFDTFADVTGGGR